MTFLEYFEQNPNKNMISCIPYADKTEEYFLIMFDGEWEEAKTPNGTYHRYDGTLTEAVKKSFAMAVNNGYYCYHGWTDEHIALDVMHEIGCAACPFRHDCQPMYEEWEKE